MPITKELLMSHSVCRHKPLKGERVETFLARQTHLSLEKKSLRNIQNLQALCPSLEALYLFENQIETLDGIPPRLTHLYVQNNLVGETQDLSIIKQLRTLHIEHNKLSSLEPLCALGASLVELHVSHQRAGPEPLHLCPELLPQLSGLRFLSLASNRLSDASPLAVLPTLVQVDLSLNELAELGNVRDLLAAARGLRELDLRDNPLSSNRKVLDSVIVLSPSLETLNGRGLIASEREYLMQLHKRGARQLAPG